jgi:hypothetical protein
MKFWVSVLTWGLVGFATVRAFITMAAVKFREQVVKTKPSTPPKFKDL